MIKRLTVKDLKNILNRFDDNLHVVITLDSVAQYGVTQEEIWVRDPGLDGINFAYDPVSQTQIGDNECLQIGVVPNQNEVRV